ncbi:MAG: LysR substrate-binding domain-containing protein [Cyclobacteriaceae bacterium]|nr:LysR substrate-binding domain-containing protein [Cyclobacteriaceae bacterium]
MNIQQFQYILAVAENKHFELAASKCFVTQSTLSTMISKFEDELGIRIFDRKKKPVDITAEGYAIIEQLQMINREIDHLNELAKEIKGEVRGNLSISVIPTIAPFLLPLFLQHFACRFPDLNIEVKEQTTSEIIRLLKSRELDIGIISIPVKDKNLTEVKLYDEPFVFFDAGTKMKEGIITKKLDISRLCLMEEGHCMRTQVLNLCDMKKITINNQLNFNYKAGSIDSLMRFVKANAATTLLPYLATIDLPDSEIEHVSRFSDPVPYRSIGIVVHRHFVKKNILRALEDDIKKKVFELLPQEEVPGKILSPV